MTDQATSWAERRYTLLGCVVAAYNSPLNLWMRALADEAWAPMGRPYPAMVHSCVANGVPRANGWAYTGHEIVAIEVSRHCLDDAMLPTCPDLREWLRLLLIHEAAHVVQIDRRRSHGVGFWRSCCRIADRMGLQRPIHPEDGHHRSAIGHPNSWPMSLRQFIGLDHAIHERMKRPPKVKSSTTGSHQDSAPDVALCAGVVMRRGARMRLSRLPVIVCFVVALAEALRRSAEQARAYVRRLARTLAADLGLPSSFATCATNPSEVRRLALVAIRSLSHA